MAREELIAQIEKAKASAKHLRAEAELLRANGEDLEDAEMLRAARKLEAQARKAEQTISLGMHTLEMIDSGNPGGVR